MTLSTWLMIFALAVGSGTSPANSTSGDYEYPCWINGTWYNPCPGNRSHWEPGTEPPDPEP